MRSLKTKIIMGAKKNPNNSHGLKKILYANQSIVAKQPIKAPESVGPYAGRLHNKNL